MVPQTLPGVTGELNGGTEESTGAAEPESLSRREQRRPQGPWQFRWEQEAQKLKKVAQSTLEKVR